MLPNPDTCTRRSNDLRENKCQGVAKDRDSNSLKSCSSDINSSNVESNEQDKRSCESRIQDTDLNDSRRLNHEAVSFDESTGPVELCFSGMGVETRSVIKEQVQQQPQQDSDSEDELEQFVFQPKGSREEKFNFSFT